MVLALLILGVGFLGGILIEVVLTAWMMKPDKEKVKKEDPEVDVYLMDPMEVDDANFGADPPTDVETEEKEDEVPRPEFLVPEETSVRVPSKGYTKGVLTSEDWKKVSEEIAPPREQQIFVALRSGNASKSPRCVGEWRERGESIEKRKPCEECGRPGQRPFSQAWICYFPSKAYHHHRGCGKLIKLHVESRCWKFAPVRSALSTGKVLEGHELSREDLSCFLGVAVGNGLTLSFWLERTKEGLWEIELERRCRFLRLTRWLSLSFVFFGLEG